MYLPGRHESINPDGYRYGFQGQELDNEVKGEGNSYNYTFRIHDPRLGRFFAVDPLSPEYPWYTPYSFSGNKVVAYIELEGLEESYFMNRRGFWTIDDPNFGEYVGNVKPTTDKYMELVKIDGAYYHQNTQAVLSEAWNWAFDTKFVEKKRYSNEEEIRNEVIREGSTFYLSGYLMNRALGLVGSSSIWKLPVTGPGSRGVAYEKLLNLKGAFKSSNFPVIDAFYQGIATSVKTLDFTLKTYSQKGGLVTMKKTLTKYIDDLYNFEGRSWAGETVLKEQVKSKVLEVGIPRNASKEVQQVFEEAINYAKDKGIQMNVRAVN